MISKRVAVIIFLLCALLVPVANAEEIQGRVTSNSM